MADLRIDLAAEFRGRKAFQEADNAVTKLNNNVKSLAKTLGIAYGTKAVIDFGKASIKAFTEDQKAAVKLANAVKNLGMAYAQPQIDKFILGLEKTTGIVDEQLRPAFQALLTTTKDLGTSYTLLNDAIDISRGSGIDLATVTQDLANGYVGITRGLKKYNTGLSQAQLKTKSFAEIVAILNKEYSGASAAYLDTYAGKLDVLSVAVDNAKESIGKGLIDAFARLAGGSTTQDAVKSIESITNAINGLITAVSVVAEGFVKLYRGLDFITSLGGLLGSNGKIVQKIKPQSQSQSQATTLAKVQIKASNAVVKSQKTLTAEQKKQAALKKAGTVFDMEQIQLVAALKGKLSDDEKLRAEAQLALLNGNVDLAKKLTDQILAAQDSTGNLARFLASLPDAKNPFQYLDAYLNGLAAKAAALGAATVNGASSVTAVNPSVASSTGNLNTGTPDYFTTLASQGAGASGGFSPVVAAAMAQPVINVTVQGSVIKEQELIDAVQSGLQSSSLSGAPSQIGRILGMFG